MIKIKNIIVRVVNFFALRVRPYQTEWVEDLPEKPRKKFMYIIGGRKYPFAAEFFCPLGCGDIISLDISPKLQKKWNVTEHQDGNVTLSPSVWCTAECRCHFWIRKGRIIWCEAPPFWIAFKKKWKQNKNKKLS